MSALSLTFVIANPSTSIDLPISGNWPDYSINWGDGTTNTSTKNHTYDNAGTYTAVLTVTSGITRFGSNGSWTGSDKLAVVSTNDVTTWGLGSQLNNLRGAFRGASTLTEVPANIPTTVISCKDMFNGASVFNQDIGGWTMGGVTDMEGMFNGASAFDQDISSWDTSTVNSMEKMFHGATVFNRNIRVWVTTNVNNFSRMFHNANAMIATYGHLASFGANNHNTPTSAFFNYVPPQPTCFPAGTPIQTDQGVTTIEQLIPGEHTLRGKSIVAITQTRPLQKHIVCFEKDSIGRNVPSQQTHCSKEHKVLYQDEMIKARDLVDMCKNVKKVDYNGEVLYNVLLEKHGKMLVNNMICETLHPENIAAKFAKSKSSPSKRILA